ncbi:MAG TPA: BamA/TamA family outer membrane protein, partial [Polyangia bacterium]|nr:BamA/TamA family outer membrane protein [Polyangia bacterium]
IEGTHAVSPRQIKKKILSSKTGWWPFAHKEYFDPVTWEADLKRIVRLYVSRGFYQARVAHDAVNPDGKDGVALKVAVEEGQPTHVGSVQVSGLDDLPPADQQAARTGLAVRAGHVFDEADWESSKSGIVAKLRARGYYRAAAAGEALVGQSSHQAELRIVVRPGVQYRFGAIDVKAGPQAHIPPVFVWDQTRLAIAEGSLFNDEALDEAQRRVFGMGVFSTVRVVPGTPDEATARIPIVVTVREAPFRTLRGGAGLKIDQIHQEARLIGEWSHRNFQGGLRKLTIHAEAGWAFLPDIWAVAANDLSVAPRNGPVFDFSVSFEQPRFLGRPSLREQNTVELQRTIEQSYNNIAGRFGTGVIWQPRSRISIFPAYRLEGDYLNGSPINRAAAAPLTLGCETTTGSCLVWLSYLEQTVTWDHRDKPMEPRKGFFATLSLQEGGGPLQGNFSYLRALPDVRGYYSILDDEALTFAGRLRVGELWPTSGNPQHSAVVTRFYGGGATSMRGFSERRMSPLLLAPVPGQKAPVAGMNPQQLYEAVPTGGNGLIDGSFEARYSLSDSWRLAGFVDFGQVTTGLVKPSDIPNMLWAVGIGIRYITSIGPIRLDLARLLPVGTPPTLYRLDDVTGEPVPVPYQQDWSCFGLFASRPPPPNMMPVQMDSACALQISIGEAY